MKRNYLAALAASMLLLASCSPVHRYGCRGGRCMVDTHKAPAKPTDSKRNA